MATASRPLQRSVRLRPKYLLFAFIGLTLAYVRPRHTTGLFNHRQTTKCILEGGELSLWRRLDIKFRLHAPIITHKE
jgi:hypothetical protein